MINKNASKLPEFTQDSLSPVHDSSSTNNWILHLPLPKNEKLRERKLEERVIRSSWTGRPPAGRRTTGAARHRGWRRAEGVAAGAARVARNNTGKWTGGGSTTPAASSATSAARDSVPRMYAGGYLALFSSPRLLGARFTGERWAAAVSGRAWSRVQGCWWFALCIYVYPSVDRVATVWTCAHTTGATRRRVVGVGGGGRGSIITRNCDRRAGY